jgi:hydrogenase maturation protease
MMPDTFPQPVLIAGLGNLLLKDDGVGVHAVNALRENPPEGTVVADVGSALLYALHLFEEAKSVLVIDAMHGGGEPGTLYCMSGNDIAQEARTASLHELGLSGAMRFIEEEKRPTVHVLGIEPQSIEYGMELSPRLKAVLPQVCRQARKMAAMILNGSH